MPAPDVSSYRSPDILPSDVCDISPFDESRYVSSSKGRSPRNFRSHRHTFLWAPQEDGVPCVSLLRFFFTSQLNRWHTTHSARGAQGDPSPLPVRSTHSAHFHRRTARHSEYKQAPPPAQDANNDVLPPHAQTSGPLGFRRRSVPSRAVARPHAPRQSRLNAFHVLAVLRRSACRALPTIIIPFAVEEYAD